MRKVIFSIAVLNVSGTLMGMQPLGQGTSSSNSMVLIEQTSDRENSSSNRVVQNAIEYDFYDPIYNQANIAKMIDNHEEDSLISEIEKINYGGKPHEVFYHKETLDLLFFKRKWSVLKYLIGQGNTEQLNEILRTYLCRCNFSSVRDGVGGSNEYLAHTKYIADKLREIMKLAIERGADDESIFTFDLLRDNPVEFEWLLEQFENAGRDVAFGVSSVPLLKSELASFLTETSCFSEKRKKDCASAVKKMEKIAFKQKSFGKNTDYDDVSEFRDFCSKRDIKVLNWFLEAGFDVTRDISLIPYVEKVIRSMKDKQADRTELEGMKKILRRIKEDTEKSHEKNKDNSDIFIMAFICEDFDIVNDWLEAGFDATNNPNLISTLESEVEKNVRFNNCYKGGWEDVVEKSKDILKKVKDKINSISSTGLNENASHLYQNSENIANSESIVSEAESGEEDNISEISENNDIISPNFESITNLVENEEITENVNSVTSTEDNVSEIAANIALDYLENLNLPFQNQNMVNSQEKKSVFGRPVVKVALGGATILGGGVLTYYALNKVLAFGAGSSRINKEVVDYVAHPTWNMFKEKARRVLGVIASKKVLIPLAGGAGWWYWLSSSESNQEA